MVLASRLNDSANSNVRSPKLAMSAPDAPVGEQILPLVVEGSSLKQTPAGTPDIARIYRFSGRLSLGTGLATRGNHVVYGSGERIGADSWIPGTNLRINPARWFQSIGLQRQSSHPTLRQSRRLSSVEWCAQGPGSVLDSRRRGSVSWLQSHRPSASRDPSEPGRTGSQRQVRPGRSRSRPGRLSPSKLPGPERSVGGRRFAAGHGYPRPATREQVPIGGADASPDEPASRLGKEPESTDSDRRSAHRSAASCWRGISVPSLASKPGRRSSVAEAPAPGVEQALEEAGKRVSKITGVDPSLPLEPHRTMDGRQDKRRVVERRQA